MTNGKWKISFPLLPIICLMSCLAGTLMVGCSSGPKNFENENDRLRAENMKLREQNQSLTQRVEGLSQQLKAHEKAAGVDLPEGLHRPTCTSIALGRYTSRADDTYRIYVRTLDARQRFVQVIANVTVQIVALPADGAPVVIAECDYTPQQLDAAYRSSFTGTHYSLECPQTADAPESVNQVTLKVTVEDLQTGLTHETEKTLTLN